MKRFLKHKTIGKFMKRMVLLCPADESGGQSFKDTGKDKTVWDTQGWPYFIPRHSRPQYSPNKICTNNRVLCSA